MKIQALLRKSILFSALAAAVTTAAGHAQSSATATTVLPIDISVTYATARANHVTGNANFWLQGGGIDLHARLYRGLGIVASATGLAVQSNNASVAPLDLVTVVFGPRYTYTPHRGNGSGRISVFGEALVGEALGFHSLFTTGSGPVGLTNGTTDSADALALQTGGGVDVNLSRHFSLRAAQVDYLRTEFNNGASNVQQNLRVGGGIVFHFD